MTPSRFSAAVDIACLEMRLVFRSRTTRYLLLISPVFITAAAVGILLMPDYVNYDQYVFLASVYNPLTYLMLAFSWNGTHGDGLFGMPVASRAHVEGRLLTAALLAVPIAGLLTIEVAVLRPAMIFLPFAGVAFSIFVAAIPLLIVSVRHPRRVDADAPPLSDIGRFTVVHYGSAFALIVPVWLLSKFVGTAELVVALTGAAGVAVVAYPLTLRWAAAELTSRIPALCEAFRRK